MRDERCDKCRFWARDEFVEENTHPDDVMGTCHRHAPAPPLNLYDIRNMLSGFAHHLKVPEESWLNWEEGDPIAALTHWPATFATGLHGAASSVLAHPNRRIVERQPLVRRDGALGHLDDAPQCGPCRPRRAL